MSVPPDPPEHPLDWEALRASARRCVAFHLQGWTPEEIDDATQDVMLKLLLFVERSGRPESADGLLSVIARRTAAIRIRTRSRRPPLAPAHEDEVAAPDEGERRELVKLESEVNRKAYLVMAWFRERHAACLELAEARSQGIDFKALAGRTGQSHAALLQRWSRCMRRLREAISRGRLEWDPPGGSS